MRKMFLILAFMLGLATPANACDFTLAELHAVVKSDARYAIHEILVGEDLKRYVAAYERNAPHPETDMIVVVSNAFDQDRFLIVVLKDQCVALMGLMPIKIYTLLRDDKNA